MRVHQYTIQLLLNHMSEEISPSFCKGIVKKYNKAELKRLVYVIQEHHATRLHWDLRFEEGGVLRSCALPKHPGYYHN